MDPVADVHELLRRAAMRQAGGVLLTVGAPPMLRLPGALEPCADWEPLDARRIGATIEALLGVERTAGYRERRQLDFSFEWAGTHRVRGHAYFQRGYPALVLRVLPGRVPTLADLGLPPAVAGMAASQAGLVVVTGPGGSGRSTTLAALVGWVNEHRPCHVVTIEDPINFVHDHRHALVDQREVGSDIPSHASGLSAVAREECDVVLVDELTEPDTISLALQLAESGRLVLASFAAPDAAKALDRIVAAAPEARQPQCRLRLAETLVGVVAQRVLPRVGGGTIGAFEVVAANGAVRGLIRSGRTEHLRDIVLLGHEEGMQTLERSLSKLVLDGLVTHEDAVGRSSRPDQLDAPPPSIIHLD